MKSWNMNVILALYTYDNLPKNDTELHDVKAKPIPCNRNHSPENRNIIPF